MKSAYLHSYVSLQGASCSSPGFTFSSWRVYGINRKKGMAIIPIGKSHRIMSTMCGNFHILKKYTRFYICTHFESEMFLFSCNLCCDQYIKTQMSSGGRAGKPKEEEQDGMSVHSTCKPPPSSASSLYNKDQAQVELELRLLEALEIYPPMKLQGVHRHFVLYGLMEFLRRKFDRHFSSEEVLQLLKQFYTLEMLKTDDDDIELLNHEEEFSLPQSYFVKEEP
ncbi:hypothetical protein CR513_61071, partial [Mucuna pruriens]